MYDGGAKHDGMGMNMSWYDADGSTSSSLVIDFIDHHQRIH